MYNYVGFFNTAHLDQGLGRQMPVPDASNQGCGPVCRRNAPDNIRHNSIVTLHKGKRGIYEVF
jgi:hypothetical protein